MRYKRVNTLAMDISSLPSKLDNATIQLFLKYLHLDPARMKSVQIHSNRKIIYFGLPDDLSAAAIAKKHQHRNIRINVGGTKYLVGLAFVDEDVVDVRVRDVPPETPNTAIDIALRKYGEVLSVTSEVWKDFFPGALTGVRVVRMKVAKNIPSIVHVGNSVALVRYDGQTLENFCRRCHEPRHKGSPCGTAAEKNKTAGAKKEDPLPSGLKPTSSNNSNSSHIEAPSQPANKKSFGEDTPVSDNKTIGEMQIGGESETEPTDFTTVKRKKGRGARRNQFDDIDTDSSAELDDATIRKMNESQAQRLNPENFTRWLSLHGGFKKQKSSM